MILILSGKILFVKNKSIFDRASNKIALLAQPSQNEQWAWWFYSERSWDEFKGGEKKIIAPFIIVLAFADLAITCLLSWH